MGAPERGRRPLSSLSRGTIAYAFLCVAIPMAWGLVVVWLSNVLERRVLGGRRRRREPPRAPMYHI